MTLFARPGLDPAVSRVRMVDAGAVLTVVVVLAGFGIGARTLHDHSLFTHLATGRLIVDRGFPHVDPYLLGGDSIGWTVPSWFPSVLYAGAERVADGHGLVLLMGLTTAAIAGVVGALAVPCRSLVGRLALLSSALIVASQEWLTRPFLVGLLCLGLTLLAADGRLEPVLLAPIWWLWVNSHGSWPLGLVALVLLAAGRRLDGERPRAELDALWWAGTGLLLAMANPYGWRILTVPVDLAGRRDEMGIVTEWPTPSLVDPSFLLLLMTAGLVAVGLCRRWSWRAALPAVAFLGLAAAQAGNIAPASLVLVAVAAAGLDGLGVVRTDRPARRTPIVAAAALGLALLGAGAVRRPVFDFDHDPAAALAHVRAELGDPGALVLASTADVGDYRELLEGPTQSVWIDDRVEVVPDELERDHQLLLDARDGWKEMLERRDVDVLVWRSDHALASRVAEADGWATTFDDGEWFVAVPR